MTEPTPEPEAIGPEKWQATDAEKWVALAEPFPEAWVERLPKPVRRDDQDRGKCEERSRYTADGYACGGYHARAVHLSYVGHAGITMRLNSVLGPEGWDFQPYAHDANGLPVINGQHFWAKLTILGVTKWDMAANYSGPQEALGDALRRCAMRFGVGTYLWSKSDHALELAQNTEPPAEPSPPAPAAPQVPPHVQAVYDALTAIPTAALKETIRAWWESAASAGHLPTPDNAGALNGAQAVWVLEVIEAQQSREETPAPDAAPAADQPALEEPPDPS